MQRKIPRWLKSGIAATVLLAGATCWASMGHVNDFLLSDVGRNGQFLTTGTDTQFNYVLHGNRFHGTARGKVDNAYMVDGRPHAARFHNTGHLSGFTILGDHTLVKINGDTTYVAHGTKP